MSTLILKGAPSFRVPDCPRLWKLSAPALVLLVFLYQLIARQKCNPVRLTGACPLLSDSALTSAISELVERRFLADDGHLRLLQPETNTRVKFPEKGERFSFSTFRVPWSFVYTDGLTVSSAKLFVFLCSKRGAVVDSDSEIAAGSGLSVRTVQRELKRLKDLQIVDVRIVCRDAIYQRASGDLRELFNNPKVTQRRLIEPGAWLLAQGAGRALTQALQPGDVGRILEERGAVVSEEVSGTEYIRAAIGGDLYRVYRDSGRWFLTSDERNARGKRKQQQGSFVELLQRLWCVFPDRAEYPGIELAADQVGVGI